MKAPTKMFLFKSLVLGGLCALAVSASQSNATLIPTNRFGQGIGPGAAGAKTLKLDQSKSHLMFHVIKDDTVTVRGKMYASGTLGKDGKLSLTVDLNSIDSQLEPRDNNIKTAFFEVAKPNFAKAGVELSLTRETLEALKKKEPFVQEVTGSLTLHGTKANFTAKAFLSPGKNGGLRVVSQQPVEIHMDTWGLGANLTALMKLCGHRNVAKPAQVTYDLSFQ